MIKHPTKRRRLMSNDDDKTILKAEDERTKPFSEKGISTSLVKHLVGTIAAAAQSCANNDSSVESINETTSLALLRSLLATRSEWSNKDFSEQGTALCKALIAAQKEITITPSASLEETERTVTQEKEGLCMNESTSESNGAKLLFRLAPLSVPDLLAYYENHLSFNRAVFENITVHHQQITERAWESVCKDSSALERYRDAAHRMGEKAWVHQCNRLMAELCVKFFRDGGAAKHFLRQKRRSGGETHAEDLAVLARDVLDCSQDCSENSPSAKSPQRIQLLDVGSCYNPIAQYEASLASQFDITALDLCPSHPSVLQADFLALDVSAPHSPPEIVEREGEAQGKTVKSLAAEFFDAVTMSLVLSYLPTPEAREAMVSKARALLRCRSASSPHPHRTGLLVIAEKQSIIATPAQQQKQQRETSGDAESTRIVTVEDWKRAICSRGFSCVSYQFFPTSDGRRSHVFVFAAEPLSDVQHLDPDSNRLFIKHDAM